MSIRLPRALRRPAVIGAAALAFAAACAHQPPPRATAKFVYAAPAPAANAAAPRLAALAVTDARRDRSLDQGFANDLLQEVRGAVQAELQSTGLFSDVRWGSGLGMKVAEGQNLWKVEVALTRTDIQIERDASGERTYGYARIAAAVIEHGSGRRLIKRDYLGVAIAPAAVARGRDPSRTAALLAEALQGAMAKFKSELGRVAAAA